MYLLIAIGCCVGSRDRAQVFIGSNCLPCQAISTLTSLFKTQTKHVGAKKQQFPLSSAK